MREFFIMRRLARLNVFKRTSEPDTPRNTTKRKKYTGSYGDLLNLPSAGASTLQDSGTGKLVHVLDYDPLP